MSTTPLQPASPNTVGRRDPATHRQTTVSGRFTTAETTRLRDEAERRAISLAEWVRETLLAHIDPTHKALVFELDAVRQLLIGIIVHLATDGREMSIAQLKVLQREADERATKRATAALAQHQPRTVPVASPRIPEAQR
jgi:hypothetical protein